MKYLIQGYSDDLITVEGDLAVEIDVPLLDEVKIALRTADGEAAEVTVVYRSEPGFPDGVWRFWSIMYPAGYGLKVGITRAETIGPEAYSDRLTIETDAVYIDATLVSG